MYALKKKMGAKISFSHDIYRVFQLVFRILISNGMTGTSLTFTKWDAIRLKKSWQILITYLQSGEPSTQTARNLKEFLPEDCCEEVKKKTILLFLFTKFSQRSKHSHYVLHYLPDQETPKWYAL